jgi:hypothetical protein
MFDKLEPQHTKIEKIIEIKGGYVILEAYSGYPVDQSNLYFVSEIGEAIWFAERPAPDAHYIRVRLEDDGKRLSAYTTSRHACDIDINSGKLISQIEFK